MNLLLTCADVSRFATEHLEGELSASLGLRMKAHLAICKTCRAFVESLRALSAFVGVREEFLPTDGEIQQQAALAAALVRLAQGAPRPSSLPAHPIPAEALASLDQPDADPTLKLMAEAYQALHGDGPVRAEPFLPEAVRRQLPEASTWRWHQALLGGCRAAELLRDPRTGSRLLLMVLPPGKRFPDHHHLGGEDFLVLHGHAEDEAHYLSPGDWLHRGPHTDHHHFEGRQDVCWGLARVEKQGVRLKGWRGRLQRAFGA